MTQASRNNRQSIAEILNCMTRQREDLFVDLAHITHEQLWRRAGPGEWSIGENIDHLRVIYGSMLPWFQLAWFFLRPLAQIRRKQPYRTEIDNVYKRPGFPQKVGWIWPPKYTPNQPVSLKALHDGLVGIQQQVSAFYRSKDEDLLGNIYLWDPAIGVLNLIQALRVGVYHDEVHIDSIREMYAREIR